MSGAPTTPALEATFTVMDFETTGVVKPWPDEPWQVGLVVVERGEVKVGLHFMSLLRVGDRPFNPRAPGRYSQVRDQLAAAPSLRDLWPLLQGWVTGRALVAHNIGTEKKIMRQAAPLHKLGPWIDTLKLARTAFPQASSHSLGDLLTGLDLMTRVSAWCPGRGEHDALFDAYGSAALLLHLLRLPGWEGVTVDQLASAHPEAYFRNVAQRRMGRSCA